MTDEKMTPAPPDAPGIFVYTVDVGDGNRQIRFDVINQLDPLVAPALLELAYKAARQQMGLA